MNGACAMRCVPALALAAALPHSASSPAPRAAPHLVQGGALLQRARGGGLDDGAVCQGVGVGHAQLNHIGANLCVQVGREQGAGSRRRVSRQHETPGWWDCRMVGLQAA